MIAKLSIALSAVSLGALAVALAHTTWHWFPFSFVSGTLTFYGGIVPSSGAVVLGLVELLANRKSEHRVRPFAFSGAVFIAWFAVLFYASSPA
jgi:hypothetical protein